MNLTTNDEGESKPDLTLIPLQTDEISHNTNRSQR